MGRAPCCDKSKVKKGPWSPEEDATLRNYIQSYGTGGNWIALPTKAGLKRCGKSCRLRWLNYLRPDIKHGDFTVDEDNIIYSLYGKLGSRWSIIASHLQGRTDNDVKNHWNTKLKKKLLSHVSKTNFNETDFTNPTITHFNFQNSTPLMPASLVPETNSDFSNILLNQSSQPMTNTCSPNNYNHISTYTTSSSGDNISGISIDTMENNTLWPSGNNNLGIGDLGFSEVFGAELVPQELMSGIWSQEIIGDYGSFYPNLGTNFYQSVTNQY